MNMLATLLSNLPLMLGISLVALAYEPYPGRRNTPFIVGIVFILLGLLLAFFG